MNNRWLITAAALLGLFAASGQARAAVIVTSLPDPTNETNLLAPGSDGPTATGPIAFRTLSFMGSALSPGFHGTVTEAVFTDATTGGLDFVYQIHTDSTATSGPVRFTTSDFLATVNIGTGAQGTVSPVYGAGYTTMLNATLTAAGFTATTVGASAPEADRVGTTIGFQRSSGTDLPPGTFGNILFLRTDATAFADTGRLDLLDGGTAEVAAWVPVAVPEPSTVVAALSGLALCGVAGLRRRHRKVS